MGINLDKKLNWHSHLVNSIHQASLPLRTCCRIYIPSWVMSPKQIYCLYVTLILHRIIHRYVEWWNKSQQKLVKLNKQVYIVHCVWQLRKLKAPLFNAERRLFGITTSSYLCGEWCRQCGPHIDCVIQQPT